MDLTDRIVARFNYNPSYLIFTVISFPMGHSLLSSNEITRDNENKFIQASSSFCFRFCLTGKTSQTSSNNVGAEKLV